MILISISEITAFRFVSVDCNLPKGSVSNLFSSFHCLLAYPRLATNSQRQGFQLVPLFSLPFGNPRPDPTSQKAVILACFLSCTAFWPTQIQNSSLRKGTAPPTPQHAKKQRCLRAPLRITKYASFSLPVFSEVWQAE